jgi:transcriptional regulator with XRE-family HTH domain
MPKTIHRPEYDILREKLRHMRLAAGLTQAQMSAQLRRPQAYISNIERGVRRIDVLELRDLCALAGRDWVRFVRELEGELTVRPKRR